MEVEQEQNSNLYFSQTSEKCLPDHLVRATR